MTKAVAIDSNLLLLLVVGSASLDYIGKHKRLRSAYTIDDFKLLNVILDGYSEIILLPNTLTEVSNLVGHIQPPARSHVMLRLKAVILSERERHVPSRAAAIRPEFQRLGLTDSVLLDLAAFPTDGSSPTLLTADQELAVEAEINGYKVENFNSHRQLS